jgi:hypothetical protein
VELRDVAGSPPATVAVLTVPSVSLSSERELGVLAHGLQDIERANDQLLHALTGRWVKLDLGLRMSAVKPASLNIALNASRLIRLPPPLTIR